LDVTAPEGGVFPTNVFTVQDSSNLTGVRINLPLPDATTNPADYQDTRVINTLDGFNLQPRLSIPFDGPIDVNTVTSETVFLIRLDDPVDPDDQGGQIVGINQVVWDTFTNTLHVESDELLDQHTSYALIVTNGVLDADGQAVQPSEEFKRFRHNLNFGQIGDPALKEYRKDLLEALKAARGAGIATRDIVTASVFTTQSSTAVLEKIRDQIHDAMPNPADFNLGPGGSRSVFNLNEVTGVTHLQQQTVSGPLVPVTVALPTGAVGRIAFGTYSSPDYQVHPGEYIPAVATRTGEPVTQGDNDIYFTLYLPSGDPPPGGWPVVIWSHGGGGNKDASLSGVQAGAATMAAAGIATIGINAAGHGFGPGSMLRIMVQPSEGAPVPVEFLAGGRGIDQDGNGTIGAADGFSAAMTHEIIAQRDGRIQTAADFMQLVRVIQVGMDVDGDGTAELDPEHIYYMGASLGAWVGTPFVAVEPDLKAAVLNTVGGPELERRLGNNRAGASPVRTAGAVLASRGLLNTPGVTSLDGLTVSAPYFNENLPLRDGVPLTVGLADGTTDVIQSPVTNDVPGTMAIQNLLDNWEWVSQPGNPVANAPYLRKDPLAGVPVRPLLVQFATGDPQIVNPSTTAFLHAGDLADLATYFRYDLAFPGNQQTPNVRPAAGYPHTFVVLTTSANATIKNVALAAQQQIAAFFASDGAEIIQPPGVPLAYFDVGLDESELPERLNYTVAAPTLIPVSSALATNGEAVRRGLYFDPDFIGTVTTTPVDSNKTASGRVDGTRGRRGEPYNAANIELLAYAALIDSVIAAHEAKGVAADSRGLAGTGAGDGVDSGIVGQEAVSIDELDLVFADLGEEFRSGIGVLN
jgi:hypothetical protein